MEDSLRPYQLDMEMTVIPFTSIGNLFFSDSRAQIRNKLNEKFSPGVKSLDDSTFKDYYDYFEASELFVYYDEQNNVNAFEFFNGNLVFKGINLLKEPFDRLIEVLSELDPDLDYDGINFTSNKYGLSGGPKYNEFGDMTTAESIVVFKKGYYDALNAYIESME